MSRAVLVISILILIALGAYLVWPLVKGRWAPEIDLDQVDATYQAFLGEHGLTDPIPDVSIVVVKENRLLYLMSGDTRVEHWRAVLGPHPSGPKTEARDGRTPVGEYVVCKRDSRSTHHLFLVITYPGRHDADAALREERIDEREHREIYRLTFQNRLPPQDTVLGGGVGIHGGGVSRDWTDGSIAVNDEVIEILWGACPIGTPAVIYEEFEDWPLSPFMPSYK